MPTTTITNVKVDRPHRYSVGALVRHRDATPGQGACEVRELTYRIVFNGDGEPVAYPTYTLVSHDPYDRGEVLDDILCTLDLVGMYETVA